MYFDDDDNSDDYDLPPFNPVMDENTFRAIMGRPVVPNEMELAIGVKVGMDFSDPYDGSIKGNCKDCDREVWIGPRQQEMINATPCSVFCPTCSVEQLHKAGGTLDDVHSLGHVHERGN